MKSMASSKSFTVTIGRIGAKISLKEHDSQMKPDDHKILATHSLINESSGPTFLTIVGAT